jgi:hypothetical protein
MVISCLGGPALGRPEEPARDELRQTQSLTTLLLREGHHAEGGG